MLRLGHHAPQTTPAIECAVAKFAKHSRCFARLLISPLGLGKFIFNQPAKSRIFRQSQDVIHTVVLAPSHDRFAAETAVATQYDSHVWPSRPNQLDKLCEHRHRARRTVDISRPQPGSQEKLAAKHVERKVAIPFVVTMKEPSQLVAVKRVVGRVKIKHNLLGRFSERSDEQIDEKLFDLLHRSRNLLVTAVRAGPGGCQFESVQRTLASQGLALVLLAATVLSRRIALADHRGQQGVQPKLVVIIQILIAQSQRVNTLGNELFDGVLNQVGITVVGKAFGEPFENA